MAGSPEPLPPETRTIGQLVAETVRLYRDHFWAALALGVARALLFVASVEWKSRLALVAVTFLTGAVLFVLLRAGSQQGIRVAAGLASLVLSPVLYLGAALLYVDQRARLDRVAAPDRKGGSDADLHPALQPDRPGGTDAEVEPQPA